MTNLFRPRLSDKKLHSSFREILSNPDYTPTIGVIERWATDLLGRHGETNKFINEFQSTFNSSMWEIYLNAALKSLGCAIDYSKKSPDFFVTAPDGNEFNIEAVISDLPNGTEKIANLSTSDFLDRGALKLAGKIKDKRDIFIGANGKKVPYSSLDHVRGRPFVIAIAPFDSHLALTQNNQIINRVLFGIEPPGQPNAGRQSRLKTLTKPSGASVEMGIFTSDSHKEISAVLFSTTGTFGKAVVESGISRIVRSTRYRVADKASVHPMDHLWKTGVRRHKLDELNYVIRRRWEGDREIFGPDTQICHSQLYRESILDGLHVYYNPYAEVPFDKLQMWPKEVTHNYYDPETAEPLHDHSDGSLVSRQVFEPSLENWVFLLSQYGFI